MPQALPSNIPATRRGFYLLKYLSIFTSSKGLCFGVKNVLKFKLTAFSRTEGKRRKEKEIKCFF